MSIIPYEYRTWSWSMFPLIFQSLCAHKISFVKQFIKTHLYLEWRVWNNVQKHVCGRNIYVLSKFSCVPSSHGLCAHTHSLEGALVMIPLPHRYFPWTIVAYSFLSIFLSEGGFEPLLPALLLWCSIHPATSSMLKSIFVEFYLAMHVFKQWTSFSKSGMHNPPGAQLPLVQPVQGTGAHGLQGPTETVKLIY